MNGLDLFSGIGGISIALSDYVRTVAYCEQDRYCQSVLLSRMSEGFIDNSPIWDDVKTLRGDMLPRIDIIAGGFPCQDISVAGSGKGLDGERSGLFCEIVRLTKETNAPFVFLENVPAIRTRGLRQVVGTFAEMGYDCRWTCLSAASVGANHKRERWFMLAYSHRTGRMRKNTPQPEKRWSDSEFIGASYVSNSYSVRGRDYREKIQQRNEKVGFKCETLSVNGGKANKSHWWKVEPDVCRVVDGLPNRVDRIKCLGNSVVSLQVKTAFEKLIGY